MWTMAAKHGPPARRKGRRRAGIALTIPEDVVTRLIDPEQTGPRRRSRHRRGTRQPGRHRDRRGRAGARRDGKIPRASARAAEGGRGARIPPRPPQRRTRGRLGHPRARSPATSARRSAPAGSSAITTVADGLGSCKPRGPSPDVRHVELPQDASPSPARAPRALRRAGMARGDRPRRGRADVRDMQENQSFPGEGEEDGAAPQALKPCPRAAAGPRAGSIRLLFREHRPRAPSCAGEAPRKGASACD